MQRCLFFLLTIGLTGCVGGPLAKLAKELKNDPATVNVRVSTVYGTLIFTRTAPGTNTAPHTIEPDGTVVVGKKQP